MNTLPIHHTTVASDHAETDEAGQPAASVSRERLGSSRASLVRRIVAVVCALAAAGISVGASTIATIDAHLGALMVQLLLQSDSVFATYAGQPSVGFNMSGAWLVLPVTELLSSAYLIAIVLVITGAAVWFARARARRVVSAFALSIVAALLLAQARLVALISLWGNGGINSYHAGEAWITIGGVLLTVIAASFLFYGIVVRPGRRRP